METCVIGVKVTILYSEEGRVWRAYGDIMLFLGVTLYSKEIGVEIGVGGDSGVVCRCKELTNFGGGLKQLILVCKKLKGEIVRSP